MQTSLPVKFELMLIDDFLAERKFSKATFFVEINENDERAGKKKFGNADLKMPERPTVSRRGRERQTEESQEEIAKRIEQELEEELLQARTLSEQLCSRCVNSRVDPDFVVSPELGYCEDCAHLLGLEASRETRIYESSGGGVLPGEEEEEDNAAL